MIEVLRIATRKSALALWQAEFVASELRNAHPGLRVELVAMTTQGDKLLDSPLAKIGGKGLFVKELEQGMLDGRADIAVHSMKDVPVALPDGLHLPIIMARENPLDALVSNRYGCLSELPADACVGTCSLRRQSQLLAHNPGFNIAPLRGSVDTRLGKLDAGEFDAIVLAAAGLVRMGWESRIAEQLSPRVSLPAVGQGALGIECRKDDTGVYELIAPLHDETSAQRVWAERALNERLNGGCQVPIAAYAEIEADTLSLNAMVATPDGETLLRAQSSGSRADATATGIAAAEQLLEQGAANILASLGISLA